MRLGRIGFDQVRGYLDRGMEALQDHPELVEQLPRITAGTLDENRGQLTILDVRAAKEWQAGHIEGSLNIPLNQLSARLDEVPTEGKLAVHCQGGYRSSIAASLLLRAGRQDVMDLIGGYQAWRASKLPVDAS